MVNEAVESFTRAEACATEEKDLESAAQCLGFGVPVFMAKGPGLLRLLCQVLVVSCGTCRSSKNLVPEPCFVTTSAPESTNTQNL